MAAKFFTADIQISPARCLLIETAKIKFMKTPIKSLVLAVLGLGLASGHAQNSPLPAQTRQFFLQKEAQEKFFQKMDETNSDELDMTDASSIKSMLADSRPPFFAAAKKGDWPTVSNLWSELESGV